MPSSPSASSITPKARWPTDDQRISPSRPWRTGPATRQTSAGAFLALDPEVTQQFIAALGQTAGQYTQHTQKPVLMASMDIRRYVRRLIEKDHYSLPVVSYQELTTEITVQPVGRIRL